MEEGLTVDGGRLRGKLREDGEKRMEERLMERRETFSTPVGI